MNPTVDKVSEFRERLQRLYDDIRGWMAGSALQFREHEFEIDENEEGPYPVNDLELADSSGNLLATIRPEGIRIIGADGQVRVIGPYDTKVITYYVDSGPTITVEKSINGK